MMGTQRLPMHRTMRIHHLNCGSMCPLGRRLINGDGGWLASAHLCCHCLLIEGRNGLTLVDTNKDPKTRLQEFLQSRACDLPRYEVVDIQGEPHCRTFFVECEIALLNEKSRGQGVSRRIAEQVAAAAALIALGVENGHD